MSLTITIDLLLITLFLASILTNLLNSALQIIRQWENNKKDFEQLYNVWRANNRVGAGNSIFKYIDVNYGGNYYVKQGSSKKRARFLN